MAHWYAVACLQVCRRHCRGNEEWLLCSLDTKVFHCFSVLLSCLAVLHNCVQKPAPLATCGQKSRRRRRVSRSPKQQLCSLYRGRLTTNTIHAYSKISSCRIELNPKSMHNNLACLLRVTKPYIFCSRLKLEFYIHLLTNKPHWTYWDLWCIGVYRDLKSIGLHCSTANPLGAESHGKPKQDV